MSPESIRIDRVLAFPYRTRKEEVTAIERAREISEAVRTAVVNPFDLACALARRTREARANPRRHRASGEPRRRRSSAFSAPRAPEAADIGPDRERTDFALLEHAFRRTQAGSGHLLRHPEPERLSWAAR